MSNPAISIIDTHQHSFWHGRDGQGLIDDMDEHGISSAWLLTWEIPEHPLPAQTLQYTQALNPARMRPDGSHPGITLEDLLATRALAPERFVLGYCPDPAKPGAVIAFEAACKMYGVQVCGEWKFRMLIDDPRSLELFRAAGRHAAPVVLHLDVPYLPYDGGTYQPAWYGGTIDNLERAMLACPETTFIGHAPGFWREISGDAATSDQIYPKGDLTPGGRLEGLFERHPNLMADLSAGSALIALRRDPGYSREFLCRFSDRVLFARDYYGGDLHAFLQTLDLPKEVADAIYFGNATRLVPPRPSSQAKKG